MVYSKSDTAEVTDISLTDLTKMTSEISEAVQQIGGLVESVQLCLKDVQKIAETGAPYSDSVVLSLKSIATSVNSLAQQVEPMSTLAIAVLSQSMHQMVKGFQNGVIEVALETVESSERP